MIENIFNLLVNSFCVVHISINIILSALKVQCTAHVGPFDTRINDVK